MPIKAMLRAKYDFEGAGPEELGFKEGDSIYLLHRDDSGWAKGRRANGTKGWFPIDFTEIVIDVEKEEQDQEQPDVEYTKEEAEAFENLPEFEKARHNITEEILSTERTYSNSLIIAIDTWKIPLQQSNLIDARLISKIFLNLDDLRMLSERLLTKLECIKLVSMEELTVGEVFLQFVPEFQMYENYLKAHHHSISIINQLMKEKKSFVTWHQTTKELPVCTNLDLLSFLIMPVQRILRYKLLLQELIKNTPGSHYDYKNLNEAIQRISDIAVNVNEKIKEEENFQKLCQIQKSFVGNVKNIVVDNRKFIREGPVMKVCRKNHQPRWFFLFSDALMVASVASSSSKNLQGSTRTGSSLNMNTKLDEVRFMIHRSLNLESTRVKSIDDTDDMKNAFQILTTEEKSFTVFVETPEEKKNWLKDFEVLVGTDQMVTIAPVWQTDASAKQCFICHKGFNAVLLRKHHCRYCGRVVCGSCSPNTLRIPSLSAQPVRVCQICFEDLKNTYASRMSSVSSLRSMNLVDGALSPLVSPTSSMPSSPSSSNAPSPLASPSTSSSNLFQSAGSRPSSSRYNPSSPPVPVLAPSSPTIVRERSPSNVVPTIVTPTQRSSDDLSPSSPTPSSDSAPPVPSSPPPLKKTSSEESYAKKELPIPTKKTHASIFAISASSIGI
eukprot:TRINITY_DN5156_c0_g1_i4.p1 TRINITY_DN5156_c0_g1~~TRINITY_DN5156_c0_g1_i4.p1  ORF type:complete len:668 (-),score=201.77 TRINITY_DN5156_c0_g1_i4:275-2278(-)